MVFMRRSKKRLALFAVAVLAVLFTYNYVWVIKEPATQPSPLKPTLRPSLLLTNARDSLPLLVNAHVNRSDNDVHDVETSKRFRVVSTNDDVPRHLCPQLRRPMVATDNQTFQTVDGSENLYVFSAFLDEEEQLVRVVGLAVTGTNDHPLCFLWHDIPSSDDKLVVVSGKLQFLPEDHGRRYSAVYITCPLKDGRQPYALSVSWKDCATSDVKPTNLLAVVRPHQTHNFTVCVTALNYKYSRAYELVEMIELNRLLGADKFVFYVNSVGSNVESVLRWYATQGLVDLIDWRLPMRVDHWPPAKEEPEVHYFGQLASHNDCLNRFRWSTRYLVYQDLDEFIIPKKRTTWAELIEDVDKTMTATAAAYVVRCTFFRKEWPRNSENYPGRSTAEKFKSVVLSTDKRENSIFPHGVRSKFIVDPKRIQTVGIHSIWSYRGGSSLTNVPPHDALLHHYRSWENPSDSNKAVRDTDIYRFKDKLLERLTERWQQLPVVSLDVDISNYGTV